MMAERTLDIFSHAIDLQGPQRDAYLDEACRDRPELRAEVEELLRVEAGSGDFLASTDESSTLSLETAEIGEQAGDVIGRYKLLQQIGEGGFGVVFMAEQTHPVRRRVALKVIKLGMDTRQVVARFEAERQALAMMDHPNIASVLDAGATESGRPYFVMELVNGVPITEYCDSNTLTTRERLELFVAVCSAVQHAHQQGVIHRDIKPSNVMVTLHDGQPVPKVIDFGIAKATNARLTEKTLFTEFRQFIGTPEYVSPEQAEYSGLGVDTRSDVYSLGVLLYELLTGVTPFDGATMRAGGFATIQRTIREEEPPAPSTRVSTLGARLTDVARHRRIEPGGLGATLRGELDWIVLKAIEKDRRRRYDSASALARDVRRHLDGEIVEASPASRTYRLAKAYRRHRAGFISGGVVAASLAMGLVGTTTMSVQAATAREVAETRFDEAEQAREDATALNEYFMTVFGEVGWGAAGGAAQPGATEMTALQLLHRALRLAPESLGDKPLLEASVRNALSSAVLALGDTETAQAQSTAIAGLYERAGLGEDDPRVLANRVEGLLGAGSGDIDEDRLDTAIALERELRERVDPCDGLLVSVAEGIGHHLAWSGRTDEAIAYMEERLGACDPATLSPRTRAQVMRISVGLADAYLGAGRVDDAESLLQDVLEQASTGLARGYAQLVLGGLWMDAGRFDEGVALFDEGLEAYRRTLGAQHPYTLGWQSGYAFRLVAAGRPAEALEVQRRVVEQTAEQFGPDAPDAIAARMSGSYVALVNGEVAEAEAMLAPLDEILVRIADGENEARITQARILLELDRATIARMRGDAAAAITRLRAVLDRGPRQTERLAEMSIAGALHRELGYALAMQGDRDGARRALLTAREFELASKRRSAPQQVRWIDADLAALDAGTFEPRTYFQVGWTERPDGG
jgi:tetratricopeptide (TPR) repeat protein